MLLRWGIAGCGRICNDFVAALKSLPVEHHQVVAVAARDTARAEEFAVKFEIPKFYGAYDQLAFDQDIDIVYIGVINTNHRRLCAVMLTNNKHVLCEKPLTLHLDDTQQLTELAKKQGKYLMEGIWSRCFPAYKQLKQELADKSIGDVKILTASYGFAKRNVPNLVEREMGGGILFNVGCYAVQLAGLVFGNDKPVSVKASSLFNETGADDTTAVILQYESGAMAQLMVSMSMKLDSTARIVGTTGEIELPGTFIAPIELKVNQKSFHYPLPAADARYKTNYTNSVGLAYQAEDARQSIINGQTECQWMTHDDSTRSAELMERICKETGLKYD